MRSLLGPSLFTIPADDLGLGAILYMYIFGFIRAYFKTNFFPLFYDSTLAVPKNLVMVCESQQNRSPILYTFGVERARMCIKSGGG